MESLLKPMPADALLRRKAPQAQFDPTQAAPKLKVKEAEKAPEEEPLDVLIETFVQQEPDDDEPLEDAVPTESMPVPACVPLFEKPVPERAWWWLIPVALGVAAAVGCVML